jgi:hypothetical protein
VTPSHNCIRDFDPYRESVQTRAIAAAVTEDMVRDDVATPPSQGIFMQQCIKSGETLLAKPPADNQDRYDASIPEDAVPNIKVELFI